MTLAVAPPRCLGTRDLPAISARARGHGARRCSFPRCATSGRAASAISAACCAAAARLCAGRCRCAGDQPGPCAVSRRSSRFSPYAPSSRLFLNILFGDPALVGGHVTPVPQGDLIDWEEAIPRRMAALRRAFAGIERGCPRPRRRMAGRAGGGTGTPRHFRCACSRISSPDGARGWQDWPREYHDPATEAVARFAAEHRRGRGFLRLRPVAGRRQPRRGAASRAAGRDGDRPDRRSGGRHGRRRQPCVEPPRGSAGGPVDRRAARSAGPAGAGLGADRLFAARAEAHRVCRLHRHAARRAGPCGRRADRPCAGAGPAMGGAAWRQLGARRLSDLSAGGHAAHPGHRIPPRPRHRDRRGSGHRTRRAAPAAGGTQRAGHAGAVVRAGQGRRLCAARDMARKGGGDDRHA